jgi:TonB-linked SusC/RagA family outer membrane protein
MKRYILKTILLLGLTLVVGYNLYAQGGAATVRMQGRVLDEAGQPIPSAKIYYNSGSKVAFSGADGSFAVDIILADVVIIEADGYEPIKTDGSGIVAKPDQILSSKPVGLKSSDLVKVPFGQLYSRQLTGAVTVIKPGETMLYDRTESVNSVIRGRTPGIFGNSSNRTNSDFYSGVLNESGNMVYVIDGVPRVGNNLNLSEIESVTVLKDITTRALYGAQALDGVVLITTKRGEAYKRKLNLAVDRGLSVPISYPDFLGTADYMSYYDIARTNDGLPERYGVDAINAAKAGAGNDKLKYPDEDYYNSTYLKNTGSFTNVVAEASGGNSSATYYVNIGWKNTTRLLQKLWKENYNDGMNTFNIRGNVDYKINDFLTMRIDGVVFYESDNTPRFSGTNQDFFTRASSFLPNYYPVLLDASLLNEDQLASAKLINGMYVPGGTSEYPVNIYGELANNGYYTSISRILQNNTRLDIDLGSITEGLSASTYVTFDMIDNYSKYLNRQYAVYQPVYTMVDTTEVVSLNKIGIDQRAVSPVVGGVGFARRISLTGQLNYVRSFNDIHNINIAAISYTDYQSLSGRLQDEKTMLFGIRANYMLKDKYVAEVNLVQNGSSKLEENKWGTSPSVGLGWIISEESFLKGSSAINYLKLRANAGILKTDGYSDYRQYMTYYSSAGNFNYAFGEWTNVARNIVPGNPNIAWTNKQEMTIGFESVLADNKLYLEASLFNNKLSGLPMLLTNVYPGFVEQTAQNWGEFTDKGAEWGLKYNINLGKASLTIGHNAVFSSPKRIKDNVIDYAESWRKRTGVATDAIFGLVDLGFYQVSDFNADGTLKSGIPIPVFGDVKPGDIRYDDFNDDGFISEKDEQYLGNSSARFQYGINVNLKVGAFELFLLGTGQIGSEKIYNSQYYWVFGDRKYSGVVQNSWTPATAATADYPRLTTLTNNNNFRSSTFWMMKDNFFTLHTAQLTYNLPFNSAAKAAMKGMQVYLRGTNILTVSENRERRELNTASSPQMRYYSVGVTAAF